MYTVKSGTEFIADIRAVDERLKNIRLSSINVKKDQALICYNFICDKAVDEELRDKILKEAEKITSKVFKFVQINVKKIVSNDELINIEIYKYIVENYPSLSIYLKTTDVYSTVVGDVVKFVLRLTKDGVEYVRKNGALTRISEYLSTKFCSDFVGSTDIKEADETIDILSDL